LSGSPLVSVVMPNLNKGHYIRFAIDSVLSQTYQKFELIIVDGGSTDESLNIIHEYASKYSNIVLVTKQHKGPGAAKNLGLGQTRGELIAFIDSDDVYDKDKLSRQVQLFGEDRNFVCFTDAWIIDGSGASTGEIYNRDIVRIPKEGCEGIIFRQLLRYDYVMGPSVMIPKDLLKLEKFDTTFDIAEDWDLWVRLARHFSFRFIEEALYGYRIFGGNTMSVYALPTSLNMVRESENILALHKKWLKIFDDLDPADRKRVVKQIRNLEFRLIIAKSRIAKYLCRYYDRSVNLRTLLRNLNEKWSRR
jgi:glycosyltransferase involved in cell wall biosynthesis